MKPVDTHSHLYSTKFAKDHDAVIARAQQALAAVFLPNIDRQSVEAMWKLVDRAPSFFFPMMGLHPTSVPEDWEAAVAEVKRLLDDPGRTYVAIGETGLDLYWDKSTLPRQQASLREHIRWAKEKRLPIVLHARDAIDETADMIEAQNGPALSGIFHCFDGTLDQARRIIEFGGFKLGIGGIVTYRKDVQEVVAQLPIDQLVLETDSPYLPPHPVRKSKNRRNESSYIPLIAEKVAELHNLSVPEVNEITTQTALELFSVELPT